MADGNDLRARLLRSAMEDAVPERACARAVSATLAMRRSTPAAPGSVLRGLLGKAALSVIFMVGGDTVTTNHAVHRAAASTVSPSANVAIAATTRDVWIAPIAAASSSATTYAKPHTSDRTSSPSATSLAEEVAALDAVRTSLHRGELAEALEELARYDRDFVPAQLAREATLLRIEALEKKGDRVASRALATAFLRANPESPLAARIAALLGEDEVGLQLK